MYGNILSIRIPNYRSIKSYFLFNCLCIKKGKEMPIFFNDFLYIKLRKRKEKKNLIFNYQIVPDKKRGKKERIIRLGIMSSINLSIVKKKMHISIFEFLMLN